MLWSDFINTWVQGENFEKPEAYFKNQFAILLKSKIWSYLSQCHEKPELQAYA